MQSVMHSDNITAEFSSIFTNEILENSNDKPAGISRENNRCPLCNSIIRLFFINFNEKVLMCENTECEFPFGYEDLQFVKEDENLPSDDETVSIKSNINFSTSPADSVVSTNAWTDIDRLNRAYDSEESQTDTGFQHRNKIAKNKKAKINNDKIRKHIEDIKELNEELIDDSPSVEETLQIKNEKWIQNLRVLQENSGVQLLKPEELGRLKKEEPFIGPGELKINIDPGNMDSLTSIEIQIHNRIPSPPADLDTELPVSTAAQPTGQDPLPV